MIKPMRQGMCTCIAIEISNVIVRQPSVEMTFVLFIVMSILSRWLYRLLKVCTNNYKLCSLYCICFAIFGVWCLVTVAFVCKSYLFENTVPYIYNCKWHRKTETYQTYKFSRDFFLVLWIFKWMIFMCILLFVLRRCVFICLIIIFTNN